MTDTSAVIKIYYEPTRLVGRLERDASAGDSIWNRLRSRALVDQADAFTSDTAIELSWPVLLGVVRDFGSRQQQQNLDFRFAPQGDAIEQIRKFSEEFRKARSSRNQLTRQLDDETIQHELAQRGFTKRKLKPFQLRDLRHLASLPHGANFSVPGSGKTTVAFALYLLTSTAGQHLFVVAPKSAFPAWRSIVADCMEANSEVESEPFTVLDGGLVEVDRLLRSGAKRFLMTYDLMIRQAGIVAAYLARQQVHLVLDEAHRMKAGLASQRGAFLLSVASLPVRRDILTGTPMPQGPQDLAALLGFLWPGHGFDLQIQSGLTPREVLKNLYARTTKRELGLPPARRQFVRVGMAEGQLALYGIVRNESLRQLAKAVSGRGSESLDYSAARRSVIRLLQLSSNPMLALRSISNDKPNFSSGVVDQVLSEGHSQKMREVAQHARQLAAKGHKVVIWTIFTDTILELERTLAELNPVTLYGAVPSGDETDLSTREGRLARFHKDPDCWVIIANPAASGEGISLHEVCHNAIYVDRTYVSTHYLQSVDRIHRLGLENDVETNIFIYQTKAPSGLGSIDFSVSRRLATKLRALQQLLDDPDLHEVAFDEEAADDPIDYDVDMQDLVDLVSELEGNSAPMDDEEAP